MTAAPQGDTKPEARILVVDDEVNIVELLSVSLKFQGFEVSTATNGAQALIWSEVCQGAGGSGVLDRRRGRRFR